MPDISTEVAIATTTLGSAAASISFSSISSSYTDLRLIINVAGTSVDQRQIRLQFNNDTGTNYSFTQLAGDGASASSNRSISVSYINCAWHGSSLTIPTFYAIDLFSYSGSTNKTVLCRTNEDKNGSGATAAVVGLWRSTSAINRIDIVLNTGNLNTGTTATLYGIL